MRLTLFSFCLVILAGAASASPIGSQDQDEKGSPGFENPSFYGVDVNNHDRDCDVELGHHDRGDDNDIELGNHDRGDEHDVELGSHDRDDNDAGDLEVGDHDGRGDCGGEDTHVVPEPSTLLLAGLGIAGLAISGRRR